jgi:hypothetical protein
MRAAALVRVSARLLATAPISVTLPGRSRRAGLSGHPGPMIRAWSWCRRREVALADDCAPAAGGRITVGWACSNRCLRTIGSSKAPSTTRRAGLSPEHLRVAGGDSGGPACPVPVLREQRAMNQRRAGPGVRRCRRARPLSCWATTGRSTAPSRREGSRTARPRVRNLARGRPRRS